MKKYIVILLLSLFGNVYAQDATLSWVAPTQNEDGSPLTDLAGFKIYYGVTSGGPYPNSVDIADPTATTEVITGLTVGNTYHFVATAYNSQNIESVFSGEAVKTITAPSTVPNPPVNLTVNPVNLFVYSISQSRDVVQLLPQGTVPEGTTCDGTMSVNGHYRVPISAVTWAGTQRPPVVFALCL